VHSDGEGEDKQEGTSMYARATRHQMPRKNRTQVSAELSVVALESSITVRLQLPPVSSSHDSALVQSAGTALAAVPAATLAAACHPKRQHEPFVTAQTHVEAGGAVRLELSTVKRRHVSALTRHREHRLLVTDSAAAVDLYDNSVGQQRTRTAVARFSESAFGPQQLSSRKLVTGASSAAATAKSVAAAKSAAAVTGKSSGRARKNHGHDVDEPSLWVQCEACSKWRRIPGSTPEELEHHWTCAMNPDLARASCDVLEEAWQEEYWESEQEGAPLVLGARGERRPAAAQHSGKRRLRSSGGQHAVTYLDTQSRHRPVPIGAMHQAQICIPSLMAPTLYVSQGIVPSTPSNALQQAATNGLTPFPPQAQVLQHTAAASSAPQVLVPACECQLPAGWCLRRWVCRMNPGCGFEHQTPEAPFTPLCHCGLRATWCSTSERFWCGTGKPPRLGGCGFEEWPRRWASPQSPLHMSDAEIEIDFARNQAALLTATTYGLSAHCFVAPSEHGLGLWSREPLRRGQAVVEYFGPRVPMRRLKNHTYALEVPDGRGLFIDGNFENSAADGVRSVAIYANHSRHPNCVLQHWPCKTGPDQMWIVAKEDIAAGRELRYDYEQGGSIYWQGQPPRESEWRSATIRSPPPSGIEPTIDFLSELLSPQNGPLERWPTEAPHEDDSSKIDR